eukprot:3225170-Rhodomonas_salina.1
MLYAQARTQWRGVRQSPRLPYGLAPYGLAPPRNSKPTQDGVSVTRVSPAEGLERLGSAVSFGHEGAREQGGPNVSVTQSRSRSSGGHEGPAVAGTV